MMPTVHPLFHWSDERNIKQNMKTTFLKTASARLGISLLGLVMGFWPASRAHAQLINGDFSAGNTGFTSAYFYDGPSAVEPGHYGINTNAASFNPGNASFGDHTTGTGKMMLVDGALKTNTIVWTETVPVAPNTMYEFTGWAASSDGTSPAVLRFLINSNQVVSDFALTIAAGEWRQFAALWDSGSNTSATIGIIDTVTNYVGNDFALDDLAFGVYTNAAVAGTVYPAVELVWNSPSNQLFQAQYSTSPDGSAWLNLGTPVQGNGLSNSVFDSTCASPVHSIACFR